jgi:hypothetical protein
MLVGRRRVEKTGHIIRAYFSDIVGNMNIKLSP